MNGISKEAELSIAASSMFPGFRFSPTDEELILYYLKKKLDGYDKCVEVIPEVDICKYEPWDLPAKAVINSDQEWFFFSPRGKKYPNGSQSRRATEIGYWKATGKERAVKSGSNMIGTKRTLVFHIGRAPKGERTEWIMHEYCMVGKGQDALVVCRLRRKCDYHGIDGGVNGEALFSKPLSGIDSSATSFGLGFGLDVLGTSGGDKLLPESSQKKCSSSHDSHSVECSASESDRKFRDEIMLQTESSSHHADEDDLFADILNDNIVQLDEPPPPTTTAHAQDMFVTTITNSTTVSVVPRTHHHANRRHHHHHQAHHQLPPPGQHQPSHPPWGYPTQGTANRRIRLWKLRRWNHQHPHRDDLQEGSGENTVKPKKKSKERVGLRKHVTELYLVVIVMTIVFLFSTFGTSWCSYRPPLPLD